MITNERDKKLKNKQLILDTEHVSFTPIIFTTMGRMGGEANQFYKRLCKLLADKKKKNLVMITI